MNVAEINEQSTLLGNGSGHLRWLLPGEWWMARAFMVTPKGTLRLVVLLSRHFKFYFMRMKSHNKVATEMMHTSLPSYDMYFHSSSIG